MGCGASKDGIASYPRIPSGNPPPLSPREIEAIQHRRPLCRAALLKFFEGAHPELAEVIKKHIKTDNTTAVNAPGDAFPRVGIAVSGGGWRAMIAAIAAMDGLSDAGLLDAVEVVAGLSGGSWFVQNWALGGVEKNVFHDSFRAECHPWAMGNRFDPLVHRYEGLTRMLNGKVVRRAAKVSPLLELFGKFSELVTSSDFTFFRVLLLSDGGQTMISRYASFLEDQLLVWKDATARKQAMLDSPTASEGLRPGTFPILAVTAIDTVHQPNEVPPAQRDKSINVWTEYTPFGTRHPLIEGGSTQELSALKVYMDKKKSVAEPMTSGRLAAICGSAFAVDNFQFLQNAPDGVARLAKFFGMKADMAGFLVPSALTKVNIDIVPTMMKEHAPTTTDDHAKGATHAMEVEFGSLRDAGLDFNIPFPLLLEPSSGRKLDIVLAFDAGFGAEGATELARAVELGYIEIANETVASLKNDFPVGDRVRIFYPPLVDNSPNASTQQRKGPIIVYVLLLNRTKSWQIAYSREEVQSCASFVRRILGGQVIPELFQCLQDYVLANLPEAVTTEQREALRIPFKTAPNAASLSDSAQVLEASGDMEQFKEMTRDAVAAIIKNPDDLHIHNSPLDVIQGIEREFLKRIPPEKHLVCLQRVAELAAVADANDSMYVTLTDPLDEADTELWSVGWIVSSRSDAKAHGLYEFVDGMMFDYALAVHTALELIGFVDNRKDVSSISPMLVGKMLGRPQGTVVSLRATVPSVLARMTVNEPEWRFVYSFVAMMSCTPDTGALHLTEKLIEHLEEESKKIFKAVEMHREPGVSPKHNSSTDAIIGGCLLAPIDNMSLDDCLRFDKRDEVRGQLGIKTVVESLCFIIVGAESCVANDRLMTVWQRYIEADDHGRFAYFVLEAVLFAARGVRCRTLIAALLPKAKAFIEAAKSKLCIFHKDNNDSRLLSFALYCSTFRNSGNIELLRNSNVVGSKTDSIHCCNLQDACAVGNQNAVEMILDEVVEGAPPMESVTIAIEKRFPKVLEALIRDEEATKAFLTNVQGLLDNTFANPSVEFPGPWATLQQRLKCF
jgi:hypothetical protein